MRSFAQQPFLCINYTKMINKPVVSCGVFFWFPDIRVYNVENILLHKLPWIFSEKKGKVYTNKQ